MRWASGSGRAKLYLPTWNASMHIVGLSTTSIKPSSARSVDLGLEPTGRIKTTISIVEKLKRQSFRLSKLQDIAGCRIVVDDVAEQDRVVALVSKAVPNGRIIDRRQKHSHGY